MAANNPKASRALRALSAAALSLPGLASTAAADGLQYSFDYQHYAEGERNLNGRSYSNLNLKPLSVDSFSVGVDGEVTDRLSLGFEYTQDTWSGATPVTTVPQAAIAEQIRSGASQPSYFYADASHIPVIANWDTYDGNSVDYAPDARLVHVMASASPETRRQVALKLAFERNASALSVGGGVSDEPDYLSIFGNVGGRFDFDNALTTVSWGASYTHSDIDASLSANEAADWGYYPHNIRYEGGEPTFVATRQDFSFDVGVTRILDKNSLLAGTVSFTRSRGYLSNPYKAVMLAYDDPDQFIDSTGLRFVMLKGTLEQRPTERNQWAASLRYIQYVEPVDASLHVSYRFYRDDWDVTAHTFELSWFQPFGDGWMIVPGVRYYSQSAASFYKPYFYFNQPFPYLLPRNPELPPNLDHSLITRKYFASDPRLSAFGEVSGRLALSKQVTDSITLEAGVEYARHAGSLRLGGGGEPAYADFNYHTVYAQLRLTPQPAGDGAVADGGLGLTASADGHTPAGVDYERPLAAKQYAVTYHYAADVADDGIRFGDGEVQERRVERHSCGHKQTCEFVPTGLHVRTQALDLLFAPYDWLTLEVQPDLIDSRLTQRFVGFVIHPPALPGIFKPDENDTLTAGGIGDTTVAAIVPLFDTAKQRVDASLGISIPTGNAGVRRSGTQQFLDYAQQLGSGTWDVMPSLTYNGSFAWLFWGAQGSAVWRLSDENDFGYAPGNLYRASLWTGVDLCDWLSATVRGAYSREYDIDGRFGRHAEHVIVGYRLVGTEHIPVYDTVNRKQSVFSPLESQRNYGGEFLDVGFGVSAVVPGSGMFAGNRLSLEWLQPAKQDVKGYQLGRTGTLSFAWSIAM